MLDISQENKELQGPRIFSLSCIFSYQVVYSYLKKKKKKESREV